MRTARRSYSKTAIAKRIYLSLGSNLGDREGNLGRAFELIGAFCGDLLMSRIYRTTPMYVLDQPEFLNAVVTGICDLEPLDLLEKLNDVEHTLGRDRSRERRMGPRTMDIDILLYGSSVLHTSRLVIPHPRMAERAFVLAPLLDLAPDLRDPVSGQPYRRAREALHEEVAVYRGGTSRFARS